MIEQHKSRQKSRQNNQFDIDNFEDDDCDTVTNESEVPTFDLNKVQLNMYNSWCKEDNFGRSTGIFYDPRWDEKTESFTDNFIQQCQMVRNVRKLKGK